MTKMYFNKEDAIEFGISEAIVIEYLKFWIKANKKKKIGDYDNHHWTYATYSTIAESFGFMNETQVRYALKKLINSGILITGNYNKFKYDRTTWYAFADEEKFLN